MKRQTLWRVSVITAPEAEDAIAELLSAVLGRPAVAYFDNESGHSTIMVYLRQKLDSPGRVREEIFTGLKRIKSCGLKTGPGKIVISRLRQEDWAESWKRHFKPIEIKLKNRKDELCESLSFKRSGTRTTKRPRIRVTRPSETLGRSLLVKPSWSKRKPHKGGAVVVLNPGLSFGTGHHPTTAFCLREIVACSVGDVRQQSSHRLDGTKSFLDLGTGSGILAIAAAKLGYSPVKAIDFDPEAVRIARANARANRVHQKLKILYGDVTKLPVCPRRPRQGYDLVCANLVSDLLMAERRRIAAQLNTDGTLVLAGILKSDFRLVRKAYENLGLKLVSRRSKKEWCSGSFQFRTEIL